MYLTPNEKQLKAEEKLKKFQIVLEKHRTDIEFALKQWNRLYDQAYKEFNDAVKELDKE
jgi:hypothetical protein